MNIPDRSIEQTIDHVVSEFRRHSLDHPSNADKHELWAKGRISGIRLLCLDYPKLVALTDKADSEINSIFSGDVGRPSTQSPAAVE